MMLSYISFTFLRLLQILQIPSLILIFLSSLYSQAHLFPRRAFFFYYFFIYFFFWLVYISNEDLCPLALHTWHLSEHFLLSPAYVAY